jgi:acetyltransferase-like isoleucine patch superfamily enzyme
MSLLLATGWLPWHWLRRELVRAWGGQIDRGSVLYHGFQIRGAHKLSIGKGSSIGEDAILDARGGLTIGANCNFSSQVHIWTAQHDWQSANFAYETAPVLIEDFVWLGPRVTVLPGAHIGEGAVVAAGAVVKGEVPPYTLMAGVPAKPIGQRERGLGYRPGDPRKKLWWW